MINTNESESRISAARKFIEVAERMECGDASDEEIIDAFRSAPSTVIDEIEAEMANKGMRPLPSLLNPGSPEFHAAMKRMREIESEGRDEGNRHAFMSAFLEMFRLAPPWWKAEIDQIFDETSSLSPDGYTDDGNPVFSIGTVSRMAGKSEEEVLIDLADLEDAGFQLTTTEQINAIN
jgi:hypothetical protein